MNNINNANRPRLAQLALLVVLTAMSGCDSSTDETTVTDITLEDGTKLVGLPTDKSKSLFTSDSVSSSEQYIRNYLIRTYNQVKEYDEYEVNYATVDMVADTAESDSTTTTLSSTNTVEENVDEADLIKAFSENGQDYLVTISQPEDSNFYAYNEAEVNNYKQEKVAAQLNLFSIDTSPAANLLATASLNEDAYYVSGIYAYQNTPSTTGDNNQLIAQTSLWQAPSDWSDYQAWRFGRTGIESIQLNNEEMSRAWSIVFDGHIITSRRIDKHMYIILRHYNAVDGLEVPYGTARENTVTINNNNEIITQLDIQAMIPNITITQGESSNTSAAFTLESCQLPNNDERFSNGSVIFNYVAKIDLDSASIVGVQCVLSEINQLYMNEKSLFLIDANNWSEQTSRLHRFTLADLSYDTSLTIDGTLGWRSAQFRIKELVDGTVVAITSKAKNEGESWCCWFTNNWTHKLQLFQKDENQNYAKIAELPNEMQPDNDDTPLSLGKAGEDIYGVRISENSVSVVTFQQTDPLYVFDITDRNNPAYAGELADTGFSAYLHTFDDLILGIGFDANEWGSRLGLKVELYKADTMAENGIISLAEYSFGSSASTPVETNHHAFTLLDINDSQSRIAIPATVYNDYQFDYSGLLLFTLDKDKKTLSFDGSIKNSQTNQWGWSSSWSDRAVIQHSEQGDAVHYIHLGEITSTLWKTIE